MALAAAKQVGPYCSKGWQGVHAMRCIEGCPLPHRGMTCMHLISIAALPAARPCAAWGMRACWQPSRADAQHSPYSALK